MWLRKYVTTPMPDGLPEQVQFHDLEFAKHVYGLMEAFHWRFLPSQLLSEDQQLLDDLLALRLHANIAEESLKRLNNAGS